MRILVVATAPPTHCGIASYAAQQVARFREAGHTVEVASLDGRGEADFYFDLRKAADLVGLAKHVRRSAYDRCYLHYQHAFFFSGLQKAQLVTHNPLLAALFACGFEVICHEVVYPLLTGECGRLVAFTERLKWRAAKRLWVHTGRELERLRALLPGNSPSIERRDHQTDFRPYRTVAPATARQELGIDARAKVFLCIGFLQPSKGFDRAMRAFSTLARSDLLLFAVGSVRLPRPEVLAHIQELKRLAATDPRIQLVERFLSDAEFDTWISAADFVVVPYREIWSSGVVARAKLLGKRVIAADVGGLGGQIDPGDIVVAPAEELAHAFDRALESEASEAPRSFQSRRPRAPLGLGIVAPWFGRGVTGGAERVVRETSERLAAAGVHVEVFTTQLRDYFTDWSRGERPAEELVNGIPVHRFPVEPRRNDLYGPIAPRASRGEALTDQEQRIFFEEMIRCPELPRALAERRGQFDLFLLGHYMFGTTVAAAEAVGDRGILMPFLHDEGYARLPPYRRMFQLARGGLYMSAPEAELAQRLFGVSAESCAVVGTGLDEPPAVSRFSFPRRHGLGRFLLYVGRKEEGKGYPLLLDLFRAYRRRRRRRPEAEAKLVVIGPGQHQPHPDDGSSILDLGVVSEREKFEALAAASLLVQPSLLESFSLSIMEAWQQRVPVLVNGACAVTRHHVERSGGGFVFHGPDDFGVAVDRALGDSRYAAKLGRAGRAYVRSEFGWPEVLQRTLAALERFREEPPVRQVGWKGEPRNSAAGPGV